MIENSDIKKFASRVFSSSRGSRDRKIMHPDREWLWIVSSFFIMFIVGAGVSVWQYNWYESLPDRVSASEDTQTPPYNTELVQRLVHEYESRAERFMERLGTAADSGDGAENTRMLDIATSTESGGPTMTIPDGTETGTSSAENDLETGEIILEEDLVEPEPDTAAE